MDNWSVETWIAVSNSTLVNSLFSWSNLDLFPPGRFPVGNVTGMAMASYPLALREVKLAAAVARHVQDP